MKQFFWDACLNKHNVYEITNRQKILTFYLRFRNESQPFPAQKPGLLIYPLGQASANQRPGFWREKVTITLIHF